jgi:hypothetical protein
MKRKGKWQEIKIYSSRKKTISKLSFKYMKGLTKRKARLRETSYICEAFRKPLQKRIFGDLELDEKLTLIQISDK